jgi:hypothetical protein
MNDIFLIYKRTRFKRWVVSGGGSMAELSTDKPYFRGSNPAAAGSGNYGGKVTF